MKNLTKAQRELLKQLPCHVSTHYEAAMELVDMGMAEWTVGARFGSGLLTHSDPANYARQYENLFERHRALRGEVQRVFIIARDARPAHFPDAITKIEKVLEDALKADNDVE